MSPREFSDKNEAFMTGIQASVSDEKQEDWTMVEGAVDEDVLEVEEESLSSSCHTENRDREDVLSDPSSEQANSSLPIADSPSTDEAAAAIRAAVDAAASSSDKEPLSPQAQAIKTAAAAVSTAGITSMPDGAPLPEGTVPVIVEAGSIQESKLQATLRKAGVAVAGGVMVGVGLVMIPLPTPCGVVVAASGMGVLATEFPEAQKVLDVSREKALKARDRLVESIEKSAIEHAAEEEEYNKLQASKKEKAISSSEKPEEHSLSDNGNELGSENTGPKIFMNAREKERQLRLQQQAPPSQSAGQPRYQTRRTVSRNNTPRINSDDEGLSVEESIDLARRTFRKTANHLGQTVLPYLKRLDTPTSGSNAENGSQANTEIRSQNSKFLTDSVLPYFGMQPKSAPASRATSPRKNQEQGRSDPPAIVQGRSYDDSSPQDILPYMNSPRKPKGETTTKEPNLKGEEPVLESF